LAIQYISYKQIDKLKWDACIDKAQNGVIYAYAIYLDTMAKNWDALVLDDYKAVMPLTVNKKYGIYYLYQPFFTASLGLFGNDLKPDLLAAFLSAIPNKFKYIDIYLNKGNNFTIQGFKLYERLNYVLELNKTYDTIYANFKDNIKRNIKKSVQLNCVINKDIAIDDIILLAQEQAKDFSPLKAIDFDNFKELYHHFHNKKQANTYGVCSPNGQLLASAVFLFSNKRAYYLLVGNHPNGKAFGASHALINTFIKDYAGQDLLLDFEGSDISSLAFFYASFGATQENYTGFKINKLPFWMKWLKK